jgi:hypothetical protein
MSNNDIIHYSDDDLGDFDFTPEGDLLGEDGGGLGTQHSHMQSDDLGDFDLNDFDDFTPEEDLLGEDSGGLGTSSTPEMCQCVVSS